jgi:DNA-binding transcriptional MerR regulator
MSRDFTLEELARAVQEWCDQHHISPANGQAAEQISERNIRYYRTLGLLDPPLGSYTKTFTDKHRLQLIALRLYQAHGLPLRRIRDELYGKSLDDLAALEKQMARQARQGAGQPAPLQVAPAGESWSVVPLAEEFLLISRHNRQLPRIIIEGINHLLRSVRSENENARNQRKTDA